MIEKDLGKISNEGLINPEPLLPDSTPGSGGHFSEFSYFHVTTRLLFQV